jgi:hypothetical protein
MRLSLELSAPIAVAQSTSTRPRGWKATAPMAASFNSKADEELQELWDTHGDHETMFWNPRMSFPVPIDEMVDAEC